MAKPTRQSDDEEGTPVAAYVVLGVLVLALLGVIFIDTGSTESRTQTSYGQTAQVAERALVSNPPSSGQASSGGAASAGGKSDARTAHVPPVEALIKGKMEALEKSEPSLEGAKQCYWQEKASGEKRWVPVASIYGVALSKYGCYELDSCNGGLGKGRGECYKWAPSPTAERDPW